MTFDDYCNGVLKEAIFINGIKKTWSSDSDSDTWEDVIEFAGNSYYVEAEYSFDFTHNRSDGVTPASADIDDFKFDHLAIYAEHPDTRDFNVEVTGENNPELYKALALKAEEIIVSKIYETL